MVQNHDAVMRLPYQYYPAIGEFLFRYAQLEYQLHEIIWAALDIDLKQGRILTIGTANKALRQMALTITGSSRWVDTPTFKQEINIVVEKLRKHAVMRNGIAHGVWGSPDGRPEGAQLSFMKESNERILPKTKGVTDMEIASWASDLASANERARKLIPLLNAARPSSQKKPAQRSAGHRSNPQRASQGR